MSRSVMAHSFSNLPTPNAERSVFNRSHKHCTTGDAGDLIPVLSMPILPGDTVSMKSTVMVRLNTPVVPIMDNLYVDTHFFFVPNRLSWDNWEDFITGGDHTVPQVQLNFA